MTAFLKDCPTAFHAVRRIGSELEADGYQRLQESGKWTIEPGGKYYVTRNDSSILAFHIGRELGEFSFSIAASHSDFPTFKIKEQAELEVRKQYMQLNTEGYGGMICSSWFDRPLSVAGRVILKENGRFITKLVKIDRDLVLIPSVAIHMNRKINEGFAYNKQVDLLPLFGAGECRRGDFYRLIAKEAGVQETAVYGSDLYLYNRQEPSVWGAREEFISAWHLDDLQCAYASLKGFLKGSHEQSIQVMPVLTMKKWVRGRGRERVLLSSGTCSGVSVWVLEKPRKNITAR